MRPGAPDYFEKGLTIIRDAENSLRSLLSQAAEIGDYDSVAKITARPKAIGEIAAKLSGAERHDDATHASNQNSGDYPKFYRSSDNKLVVIGWSKTTETEYEHKAPKIVLEKLVAALLDYSPKGNPASLEKIKPYLTDEQGSDFPEYYVRAFLRWLRVIGLITKQGHQGYSY